MISIYLVPPEKAVSSSVVICTADQKKVALSTRAAAAALQDLWDICCSQVQHRRQHNQRVFDYRKGFKMPNTMPVNVFPDFENNPKMQSRRTALRAALAADSLALGVHWNYSVSSSIYSCFRRFAHARPLADVASRF